MSMQHTSLFLVLLSGLLYLFISLASGSVVRSYHFLGLTGFVWLDLIPLYQVAAN